MRQLDFVYGETSSVLCCVPGSCDRLAGYTSYSGESERLLDLRVEVILRTSDVLLQVPTESVIGVGLRKEDPYAWHWMAKQDECFDKSKKLLLSSQVLAHFDPSLEIRVACDTSAYGVGAVISHKMPDGSEKPVGFVSRTLNSAEKKYSQLEKEALACVVGVTRFNSYLCGYHFTLQADHKPLTTLFNENKAIPQQAANRIQRWAWKLALYEYTVAWRTSAQHANADALSQLPLPETPAPSATPAELVLMVENLDDAPITALQIATWTRRDPVKAKIDRYTIDGQVLWTRNSSHIGQSGLNSLL